MSFGEALFTKLSTDPGVSAIVGTRVYPNKFKQGGTTPAIRYQNISGGGIHLMGIDANLEVQRYQIDLVHNGYSSVQALKTAVLACLSRWKLEGVLQGSFYTNSRDLYEDDTRLDRCLLEFDFWVEV